MLVYPVAFPIPSDGAPLTHYITWHKNGRECEINAEPVCLSD